jgi:hypothetical protein
MAMREVSERPAEKIQGDFIDEPTPESGRLPLLSLTMAWWALATAAFFIVLAPILSQVHDVPNVLVGMAVSVLVFAALGGVCARFSIRSGASVAVLSQDMFGTAGALVSALILFATTLYYAVFEGSVVSVGIAFLFHALDLQMASLVVAIYSVVFVAGPIHRWLDRVNGGLFPVYWAGMIVLLILVARRGALLPSVWLNGPLSLSGVTAVVTSYMGLWILPMCTFDFARFGRRRDLKYHVYFNFGIPYYLLTIVINGLAGIAVVGTLPAGTAVTEVSVVQNVIRIMGISGFAFLWATQTRINTAHYYLAATNLSGLAKFASGRQIGHLAAVVIVGVLAYVLMLASVISYLLVALAYQGIFVVAWVAVAFVYVLNNDHKTAARNEGVTFKLGGLTSWLLGVAAGIIVRVFGGDASFLSPLVSASVAGVAYFLMTRRGVPLLATRM